MTTTFDIVVVGGGVVGLTAALAMHQCGYSVAILDEGSFDSLQNNRVYAINEASKKLFKQLGVWQLMNEGVISPYTHMEVWDAKSGAAIHFDGRLMATQHLGSILEESHIKQILLQLIKTQAGITLFPHCCVDKVNSDTSVVQVFSGEACWEATLLMVADGAHSPTRKCLEVPMTTWPYHQNALVATVKTEKPHQKTAYQVFHPEGPLAFLPLVDPHQCSIVWTTTPLKAQALMTLPENDFNTTLTKAFGLRLGKTEVISQRHYFPLTMRHTQQYAGKNWLLLGDAAHTIHPLAGLGLNLGLADITTWLHCLAEHQNRLTSTTALGKYQRQRKYATWQVIALMEALKTVFGSTFLPLVVLRSLGIRACNGLAPLKRLIIAEAMGQ